MKNIIYFFFSISISIYGQKQNTNWFFGDSLLLNFTDTGLVPQQIAGHAHEASISISDSLGNLLFYGDGSLIWDKNFNIMSNSYLEIDQYGWAGSSITQGSIVVPDPGNNNQYYEFNICESGLKYSVINMTLNGGFGDVTEEKNISIVEDHLTEKLQAVRHANGRDWWILVHERKIAGEPGGSNTFYEVLVTPDGIEGPYSLLTGVLKGSISDRGEMIFSQDGSRLAYADTYGLEIFNFDRCTGAATELISLEYLDAGFQGYGCAFSADGNKVYISSCIGENNKIFQYCLNCNPEISETKELIFENNFPDYCIGQLELAPDNKIYFTINTSTFWNEIFTDINMNLCVINNPNEEGLACDVDTNTIWLAGRRSIIGLPNFPNYNLGALVGSECDTLGIDTTTSMQDILMNEINIYPNPATEYLHISATMFFENTKLIIYDATGQKMKECQIDGSELQVDVSSLCKGVYFYKVQNYTSILKTGIFQKL